MTEYPIRFKDYVSNRRAGQVQFAIAGSNGPDYAIRVTGSNGDGSPIDFILFSNAVQFCAVFETFANRMRRSLGNGRQEELSQRLKPNWRQAQLDEEARANPYHWLTPDYFPEDNDIKLGLIGLRFPDLRDIIDSKQIKAALAYLNGDQAADDPLEADLAKLRAVPRAELLKTGGAINKSAVAAVVGRRTGGSDWLYVSELAETLAQIWEQEDDTRAA